MSKARDLANIAGSNAFTAADETKLDGIEASADVTDADNVDPLVDAHLNSSTATNGQYLGWNGSDYDWSTVDLSTKLDLSGGTLTGGLTGTSATFSGNLLVGKSVTTFNTAGTSVAATDGAHITRSGAASLNLNRLTSDGEISGFYKDGSKVGSVGADDGRVYIESSGGGNLAGIGFSRTAVAVEPRKNSGWSNSEVDIGSSTYKFKDAHFSGTVNATSFSGDGSNLSGIGGGLDLSGDKLVEFGSSSAATNSGNQPAGVYFMMAFMPAYFGNNSALNITTGTLAAALLWSENSDKSYTSNWSNGSINLTYATYIKGFIHFTNTWKLSLTAGIGGNKVKIYNIQ